jgi:paired amphipathic helix protein Sin3a
MSSIETPETINRVSSLFTGHPALIQGFNTFLPVGYRIECTPGAYPGAQIIIVTTPSGTTRQHAPGPGPVPPPGAQPTPRPADAHTAIEHAHAHPDAPGGGIAYDIQPALEFVQRLRDRLAPDTYSAFMAALAAGGDHAALTARVEDLLRGEPALLAEFRAIMRAPAGGGFDGAGGAHLAA